MLTFFFVFISFRIVGCSTSEELFWKLSALQDFIRDLFWPDEVFANHLEQRLKLMACDMLESCLNRTLAAFQNWEKKGTRFGNPTDYIIPSEMCAMINVVLETKNQSLKLCTFENGDVVSNSLDPNQNIKHQVDSDNKDFFTSPRNITISIY